MEWAGRSRVVGVGLGEGVPDAVEGSLDDLARDALLFAERELGGHCGYLLDVASAHAFAGVRELLEADFEPVVVPVGELVPHLLAGFEVGDVDEDAVREARQDGVVEVIEQVGGADGEDGRVVLD